MIQLDFRELTQAMTRLEPPILEQPTSAQPAAVTSRVCHWLTSILYPLGRHVLMPSYFHRLTVTGQENIPKTGPVILAPTHRSRWDGLLMPYAVGRPITGRDLRYMVSADEMTGIQGWFLRRTGGFPVNTRNPGISSIRHSTELLRNGEALVLFPEGNIFQDGEVHPLKPGMARIALQVEASQPGIGLKIVPISIRYSELVPRWRCDVTVKIGTPINVANYSTKSAKKSAQKLTNDLEATLKYLDEVEAPIDILPVATP